MNKNKRSILVIVSLIMLMGMFGNIFITYGVDKQTEITTTEYIATISDVEIIDTVRYPYIKIYTNEYANSWVIPSLIVENVKITEKMKKGNQIAVRVENKNVQFINQTNFVEIVSLYQNNEVIFSLEDYNKFKGIGMVGARLGMICCGVICVCIIISYYSTLKKSKSKKQNKAG